jgi:hypothetical protein
VAHDRRGHWDRRLVAKPLEPEDLAQSVMVPEPEPEPEVSAPPPPSLAAYQEFARSLFVDHRATQERRETQQRGQRRVPLELHVRVRVNQIAERFEEVTRTANVCKGGVYILSEKPYRLGLSVLVTLNCQELVMGTTFEQPGKVVRIDKLPNNAMRGIAIAI